MSLNEHYDYISSHIDIDNIIDYYCAQLFLANTDWPHNNVKYWKAQDGGKWRWLFFDCDECMSYEYYNLMADLINEQKRLKILMNGQSLLSANCSETITNSDDVLKFY